MCLLCTGQSCLSIANYGKLNSLHISLQNLYDSKRRYRSVILDVKAILVDTQIPDVCHICNVCHILKQAR